MKTPLSIVIENREGSYKSFEIENDPAWKDYPLKGVTYPVDYGYIDGYKSEDNHDLDVFVGSGTLKGFIKVWRNDVPLETKFAINIAESEWNQILKIFGPVLKEQHLFKDDVEYRDTLNLYKR